MPEPITPEQRLAEIRDLRVDSCSADAPYNPDVWALEYARMDLLAEVDRLCLENKRLRLDAEREEQTAEVDRLKAQVQLMGAYLQRESLDAIDKALAKREAGH